MCCMHVLSSGIASYEYCSPDRYPCAACMCSHQALLAMGSVVQTGTHVLHACVLIRHASFGVV